MEERVVQEASPNRTTEHHTMERVLGHHLLPHTNVGVTIRTAGEQLLVPSG